MRPIRPINELGSRVPEAGKIRLGHLAPTKSGKTRPAALDTFRFTSPYEDLIELLAQSYGGTARAWNEPKAKHTAQFEVITEAKAIDVLVPPGGLSQHYELWAGSGCIRRCNGITCEIPTDAPDGATQEVPCLCTGNQQMECVPRTRLTVALPDLPFRGVWLLESSSWNAAEELVGMEAMLQQIQQVTTITKAELQLQQRTSKRGGQTKHFVVPVLTIPFTPTELAAGGAALERGTQGQIDAPARPALGAGALPDSTDHQDYVHVPDEADDDVAEAEIIYTAEEVATRAAELANQMILDPHELLTGVCRGISRRSRDDGSEVDVPEALEEAELSAAMDFLGDVAADRIEVTGTDGGNLTIKRRS